MDFDIKDPKKAIIKKKKKKTKMETIVSIIFFLIAALLTLIYILLTNKPKKEELIKNNQPIIIEEKPKLQIVDETSNERPIAIMIDNNIGTGKHAGLQESYINYEIIVEGGLTRIMALFKDKNVQLIGPVRSSRHYYLDYALEHDAIYAHFGWSPQAENNIKLLNVNNINGMFDSTPFTRDPNIASPHNVFTSTQRIRDYLEEKNYSPTSSSWKVLNYSINEIKWETNEAADAEVDNQESEVMLANNIMINYSYYQNRSYTYDSNNKYYLRSQNGTAHIDKTTEQQLHYKNIIVMRVTNRTIDSSGRQDLDTTGVGTGFYISNGYAKAINWSKETRKSKTVYTYTDGTEVKVNDGNTFIQIVPTTSNITIE